MKYNQRLAAMLGLMSMGVIMAEVAAFPQEVLDAVKQTTEETNDEAFEGTGMTRDETFKVLDAFCTFKRVCESQVTRNNDHKTNL